MNLENMPYVGAVFRFGANDRVLDSILLLGPVVILAMVILGRTPLTTILAAFYVLLFTGYVLYNGIRRQPMDSRPP